MLTRVHWQYGDSATFVKTLHLCTTRPPSIILVPQSALTGPGTARRGDEPAYMSHELEGDAGGDAAAGSRGEATQLIRSLRETFKTTPVLGVARRLWEEQVCCTTWP